MFFTISSFNDDIQENLLQILDFFHNAIKRIIAVCFGIYDI